MRFEELKDKALNLPLSPGVYIMKDKCDRVIYVGKAKKLKNRVSQYFQDTASHSLKTRLMVSKIDHFEVIVAASEFEALILECSLIKKHQPKYNILLKDDKGYPYIRLDLKAQYPRLELVNKLSDDGAEYFGPYGSRGVTNQLLETIFEILKLPNCSKKFPFDIGKGRVCLHYHMKQCRGWCQSTNLKQEYLKSIETARRLLRGQFKNVADQIRNQMLEASDNLQFELAASLRDQLCAVENLGKKQLVSTDTFVDTDVIGYASNEAKACFTVLHFNGGTLLDKEYEIFPIPDDPVNAVSTLVNQYYISRGIAPKIVLLPFQLEDSENLSVVLQQRSGRNTRFKVPQRGDNVRLIELANKNAKEEADRISDREERKRGALLLLSNMLAIEKLNRIESFDISNISGTDIVASMVVYEGGEPRKSCYKKFKIKDMPDQNDYESMRQVLSRRFEHYVQNDPGFDICPDLLLIDGGENHAKVALDVLNGMNLSIPVFGMVKDERHRTRALINADGKEIRIDNNQSVFALIGSIQEETHRFAINFHRSLRSKRLRYSELDTIPGIGPKRKELLLKHFKSISALSKASLADIEQYLPKDSALSVYRHFNSNREGE